LAKLQNNLEIVRKYKKLAKSPFLSQKKCFEICLTVANSLGLFTTYLKILHKMMLHLFRFLFCVVCLFFLGYSSNSFAQNKVQNISRTTKYQYFVDLTKAQNDKLEVSLIVPKFQMKGQDETFFYMPKIVPGTYSIYDFGRFLSDFQATDSTGKVLNVLKVDENSWKILGASKLYKITYKVEDSYDTKQPNFIFEPAGTNIEENSNFVINTHGFFGYLEGMKRNGYELNFTKPTGFFGSSPLQTTFSDAQQDKFDVPTYMELVDSPIMYCKPDTTVMNVGGAEILVSVYSPNKVMDSKFVAQNIKDILNAQKEYLGGKLPINRYAFIIYLFTGTSGSGAMGALEHSYSSLYFLPELNPLFLAQTVRDVAAHEFFHIITPLSIHAEQIHDFDYIKPEMSKHLWLYEGVVEYFAGHVQTKYGLTPFEDYLTTIRTKILNADGFNQKLPFTEMSKGCLTTYKDQYGNVYEKGALIGLCLDIKLRQFSKGKYGLQDLMADLSKEYGKEKAFKDEELFDKIVQITGFPELRSFFSRYVEGEEKLPIAEVLQAVGITYLAKRQNNRISMGGISIATNPEGKVIVADVTEIDALGETLGYKTDDVILEINKTKITGENIKEFVEKYQKTAIVGEDLKIVVERVVDGKKKKVKLKGKVIQNNQTEFNVLESNATLTPEQAALRKAWIGQ
jgi:predicted metalloprotease with PDZ domain